MADTNKGNDRRMSDERGGATPQEVDPADLQSALNYIAEKMDQTRPFETWYVTTAKEAVEALGYKLPADRTKMALFLEAWEGGYDIATRRYGTLYPSEEQYRAFHEGKGDTDRTE